MVIPFFLFIIASLATYRLATDLAWEIGPFHCYAALRGFVMVHAGGDSWITEGVACPICWSFWLALPAGLLIDFGLMGLAYWLGIAGAVALMVRGTTHDD